MTKITKFQSTSSAWRTTTRYPRPPHGGRLFDICTFRQLNSDFNPRPPHGGRRATRSVCLSCMVISIHVLRMEDDHQPVPFRQLFSVFQSTSSAWRTTTINYAENIYINEFQSTSSAWRTTATDIVATNPQKLFQSTSSAWRTTVLSHTPTRRLVHFNPRPPHGGRPL